jgi:hypothetical protein
MSFAMAGAHILSNPDKHWYCPECAREHVTKLSEPHTPLHQCPKLRGAWVPFVEEGIKARLKVNYREDYLKGNIATMDGDGNAIQSVQTQRDDGEDCAIFATSVNLVLKEQ